MRVLTGPFLTAQVLSKNGAPLAGVTVTPSAAMFSDRELTASVSTLTTNGNGVFTAYAAPGIYTFTVNTRDAAPIESVEVLSPDQGIQPSSGGGLSQTAADARYAPITGSAAYVAQSSVGAANGVAPLDSSSLIPVAKLPTSTAAVVRATTGAPTVLSTDIVGDFAIDTAAGIMYGPLTGAPALGQPWINGATSGAAAVVFGASGTANEAAPMTGCLGATIPRNQVSSLTLTAAATGIIRVAGRWFYAGQVVGHLDWLTGSTAAVTPTHSYMVLTSGAGVVLAATADNLTLALPASTVFNWPIAAVAAGAGTSYTIPADGFYYLGVSVSATTQPTYSGLGLGTTALTSLAPISSGLVTGASATPPAVGTTLTIGGVQGQVPWMAAFA